MSVEAASIVYDVVHATWYAYAKPVPVSHHVARLSPRALPHQACLEYELKVDPPPADLTTHTDYFGNDTTFFAMQGAHTGLAVVARSRVGISPRARPEPSATPPWERAADRPALPLEALEAIFDSPSIQAAPDFEAYARPSFPGGRPILEAVMDLVGRIHADFTFDPGATTVATSLPDVFRLRRGVCQDFARFGIACLRSMGLPARYVSGYLETAPPPGMPRLAGADASHAWLSVYCPGSGWVDVDPTNNLLPSTGHITLAHGLDYADVSPIRGVILGGGQHSLQVSVDVVRVNDDAPGSGAPP